MLRNIQVMLLFKYDFKLSIVSEFKVKKITFMLSQTHHHHQPTKTHKMVNKRYLSLCINVYVRILVVVSLDNEEPPKTKKESSLSKTCEIKRQNCCSYYDYTWKKRPRYWCTHNKTYILHKCCSEVLSIFLLPRMIALEFGGCCNKFCCICSTKNMHNTCCACQKQSSHAYTSTR